VRRRVPVSGGDGGEQDEDGEERPFHPVMVAVNERYK
jgi:hypothetical protein